MKQRLEEKIAEVAKQMQGWHYMYEGYYTANQRLSYEDLPCLLFVQAENGMFNQRGGMLCEQQECIFAFCKAMDFDADAEETDREVIETLKDGARAWIKLLNGCGKFKSLSPEINYSIMYEQMDCNVAILAIRVNVEELQGEVIC